MHFTAVIVAQDNPLHKQRSDEWKNDFLLWNSGKTTDLYIFDRKSKIITGIQLRYDSEYIEIYELSPSSEQVRSTLPVCLKIIHVETLLFASVTPFDRVQWEVKIVQEIVVEFQGLSPAHSTVYWLLPVVDSIKAYTLGRCQHHKKCLRTINTLLAWSSCFSNHTFDLWNWQQKYFLLDDNWCWITCYKPL